MRHHYHVCGELVAVGALNMDYPLLLFSACKARDPCVQMLPEKAAQTSKIGGKSTQDVKLLR